MTTFRISTVNQYPYPPWRGIPTVRPAVPSAPPHPASPDNVEERQIDLGAGATGQTLR